MPLTHEDIDDYEEMAAEAAEKEVAAYRKLLGLPDLEADPNGGDTETVA